jgi:hypothetical protein
MIGRAADSKDTRCRGTLSSSTYGRTSAGAVHLLFSVVRSRSCGATVLLVLALALRVLSSSGLDLRTMLHVPIPTSTTTLSPSDRVFYWADAVPWGELWVDGHPGPNLHQPLGHSGTGVPVHPAFTLPRGRHSLRYVAEVFPPLTCSVHVPAAPSDTCPLSKTPPSLDPGFIGSGRVLMLLSITVGSSMCMIFADRQPVYCFLTS